MKRIILLILGFLTALFWGCEPEPQEIPMAYRDIVLATQPAAMNAYFETNGNSLDSGPNGLAGQFASNVTYSLNGIDGSQAMVFSPADFSSFSLNGGGFGTEIDASWTDEFTVIFWMRARDDSVWATPPQTNLFYMYTDADSVIGFTTAPANSRQMAYYVELDGTVVLDSSIVGLGANGWYMVAINRRAGQVSIYINGLQIVSAAAPDIWTGNTVDAVIGGGGTSWDGAIDEITLWGGGLTDAEIIAIYNAGTEQFAAAPPIVGTNSVVQIFDRTGVPIGEMLPFIDFVSWRRNEIGQAVFSLAKTDAKANDVFLRAQNRVLITFDNGLPAWGGIMQPDFAIDHDTITVRALTAESVLSRRLTDRGRYFSQQTVGNMAIAMISEANDALPLGIELGAVWAGGTRHSPSYHYKDLFTIFRDSLFKRLSRADFYAEPVLQSDGRLIFRLNVVERRGRNVPGVALHQGLNVVDPTRVSFQGPIINRWVIIGDGDGWGSDRPVAVAENVDSINRHGLLEAVEIHQGVIELETLQETADNLLARSAWPRVILDITAVDLPPATFEQYDIGDNLPVELPDYGIGDSFTGAATVQARAFYPADGRLNLVLEATASA